MNPLLKEIQLDRLSKQLDANEREMIQCICKGQNPYWGPQCNSQQQMQQQASSHEQMMAQNPQAPRQFENAIPQTFLPQQGNTLIPPPCDQSASQSGPFNPYAPPIYPPGCPTPGCPGSYPGFQSNNNQPQMCYQQEFCVQYPVSSFSNLGPSGGPIFRPRM